VDSKGGTKEGRKEGVRESGVKLALDKIKLQFRSKRGKNTYNSLNPHLSYFLSSKTTIFRAKNQGVY
jgi:hypothetical protein